MIVNGQQLPESFVAAIENGQLQRERGSWQLREERDSYGNPLETGLGSVFHTPEQIKEETDLLPNHFEPDGYYGESLQDMAGPGAIADIVDFSQIICFAIAGGGEPFCFDYRDSTNEPSVIWWDDVYWRKVSPDFVTFLRLFDFSGST